MKKTKPKKNIILFVILISLFSAFLVIASLVPYEGFVEADIIKVQGRNLIIGKNCTAIVGVITNERATYIQDGLDGKIQVRPNVYDVFEQTIGHYNITLEAVKVTNLIDNSYRAKSIFSDGKKVLEIDCRPSDAVALAVRTSSSVYINETLLREVGRKVC